MILPVLLSASLTFTTTATGVEKGTPVEFVFAASDTDRAYETMFLLDDSVDEFCRKLETAGIPRGKPTDPKTCRLWPVGCKIVLDPPISAYISGKMPEGLSESDPIYTGGTRLPSGLCEAGTNMPLSAFSIFSLSQSPIVYNGIYNQGVVYNSFTAKDLLEKGRRYKFRLSCEPSTMPKSIHLTAHPGKGAELLRRLREEAAKSEIDVLLGFADEMTVEEATILSTALSTVDSPRVKLNGVTNVFYRSFQPLVKWRDRKERLVQPFELTLGEPDELVFIDEDWTVEGDDPKLTEKRIAIADASKYSKVDTCFLYADKSTTVGRIVRSMRQLPAGQIVNWYVFQR